MKSVNRHELRLAQPGNLSLIWGLFLFALWIDSYPGRFQNHRNIVEGFHVNNFVQGAVSDHSMTDIRVSVLVGTTGIQTVVDMQNGDLIHAEYPIKRCPHSIRIRDNRVTRIVYMAGIKAHPQLLVMFDPIIDSGKFFEGLSDFTSFSGHCFQRNVTIPVSYTHLRAHET